MRLWPFRRKPPRPEAASAQLLGVDGGTPFTYGAEFGWLHDVSPAAWIASRLHPFAQDVGSIIPDGFEAYGRLFHPVELPSSRRERWADVALRNDRIVHPEMQFHMISTPRGQPPPRGYERGRGPRWGHLALDERRALVEHLTTATSTPKRCWFCMWEGFGGLDDGGVTERVRLPGRNYLLYAGGIERALESPHEPFEMAPHLWWPDDRAWFVATEIDFAWTYVGGARRLIYSLISDRRLEVLPAQLSDKVTYDGDARNEARNG